MQNPLYPVQQQYVLPYVLLYLCDTTTAVRAGTAAYILTTAVVQAVAEVQQQYTNYIDTTYTGKMYSSPEIYTVDLFFAAENRRVSS